MKISVVVTIESDFLSYGIRTFAQNYLKQAQKMKKLLNQFNNFCYLRKSFDLKTQDLFETINHREYLKCGTNFIRSPFRDCKLLNQFNNFSYQNDWSKLVAYCLKFISKLLKKHVAGTNSHKMARNTKIIKSIQ